MATRGRAPESFVYAVMDGDTVVYVGKGTGRRHIKSAATYGGVPRVLERFTCETKAFEAERRWIAELLPWANKCAGGNGGRAKAKPAPRKSKCLSETERVGSRAYAARFLLTRLDDRNCEAWGASKLDMVRLREVAYGSGA